MGESDRGAATREPPETTIAQDEVDWDAYATEAPFLARRVLASHHDRLLLLRPRLGAGRPEDADALLLSSTGVWERAQAHFKNLVEGALQDVGRHARATAPSRDLAAVLRRVQKAFNRLSGLTEDVRTSLWIASDRPRFGAKQGTPASIWSTDELTEAYPDELDADGDVLGTPGGVLDLVRGVVLDPSEGRERLVTRRTAVDFDGAALSAANPGAAAVRKVLDAYGDRREPYLADLAWALRGKPGGSSIEVYGPTAGGKSTFLTALLAALGEDYASEASDKLLTTDRRTDFSAHTGGLEAILRPRRIAVIGEVQHIDRARWNKLTDGHLVRHRPVGGHARDVQVTATMVLMFNEGKEPTLQVEDPAVRRRMRAYWIPGVAEADRVHGLDDFIRTDPGALAAVLAAVVNKGVGMKQRPAASAITVQDTIRVVDTLTSEVATFAARHIAKGADDDVLTVADLWAAWCRLNDEDAATARKAGGLAKGGRYGLSARVRQSRPELGRSRLARTRGGKTETAWPGWKLVDPPTGEGA